MRTGANVLKCNPTLLPHAAPANGVALAQLPFHAPRSFEVGTPYTSVSLVCRIPYTREMCAVPGV